MSRVSVMIRAASVGLLSGALCAAFAEPALAGVNRWGSYDHGNTLREPTAISGLGDVVKIDAGNLSGYALESDGKLQAFGQNSRGELGDGLTRASITKAVAVDFPAGVKIVAIGESQDAGYAIDSTGQGWSWGAISPALCLGRPVDTTVPQKVPGMTEAVAVQGGAKHVLWLLKNGTVETCGTNDSGQLGVGEGVANSSSPVAVPGLSNVVEISAGQRSSCARTASGAIYDWGADNEGQIGDGLEQEAVYTPFKVPLPGAASDISCGGDLDENGHALAIVGGAVYGWGADGSGQLGDGQRVNKPDPTVATELSSLGLAHVAASGVYSLGLTAAGDVYAWGSNAGHALGVGAGKGSLTPLLVQTGALEISATAYNSLDRVG